MEDSPQIFLDINFLKFIHTTLNSYGLLDICVLLNPYVLDDIFRESNIQQNIA